MTAGRPKGLPKSGGRVTGTPNKMPSVRAAFERVFNELQQDPKANLKNWAKTNTTEFYKISSKLLPVDANITGGLTLNVVTGVPQPGEDDGSELV